MDAKRAKPGAGGDRSTRARRIVWFVAAFVLSSATTVSAAAPAGRASTSHSRVLIVSVDGLRPDVALRADMPVLRGLMKRGSFTMWAATTDLAVTLPSHMSMLTGVTPAKHGITYNSDPNPGDLAEPAWPTLFELAHRAGLTTAMSAGKSKFSLFVKPGVLDHVFVPARGKSATDEAVADSAARWLLAYRPQILFVHLPALDGVGHRYGWGSPEQIRAATRMDRALGRVLQALALAGLGDSTLVILSTDHGGAGKTHGGLDPRGHFIPWIAAGPGVRHDFDLTLEPALDVHTEDTFATTAAWLGLRLEKPIDGRAVREIFEPVVAR